MKKKKTVGIWGISKTRVFRHFICLKVFRLASWPAVSYLSSSDNARTELVRQVDLACQVQIKCLCPEQLTILSGYLLSEEGSQLGSKMCPPWLNFILRQQLSSTRFYLSGKWLHLCTEASGMVIGLVSSHTPDATLPMWLEGDLTLVSACQKSDDGAP